MKRISFIINFAFFGFISLITACSPTLLEVEVEYISKQQLASYHVGTPDPRLICPPIGQKISIGWHLSKKKFHQHNYEILLEVRYRDRTTGSCRFKPEYASGRKTFNHLNDEYSATSGLVSYSVTLFKNGKVLSKRCHILHTPLIEFDEEDDPSLSDIEVSVEEENDTPLIEFDEEDDPSLTDIEVSVEEELKDTPLIEFDEQDTLNETCQI
jgi:hypothetical protein